jgi:phosphoribosylaminoimidazolecarboxamide formyltransferase/IMP cyclohydrolase
VLLPRLRQIQPLRYGENPHQLAAFYADGTQEPGVATLEQLHGIPLSYINILDADAALELVREFARPAASVIKHATPCGCATGATLAEAFDKAYAGDPVSAFGGIVALNQEVDEATANHIVTGKRFLDVMIAPSYTPKALELLRARWKNCRILQTGPLQRRDTGALSYRSVTGGVLVQQRDMAGFDRAAFQVASTRQPTEREWADLAFVWLCTKHVKSNAIAVARDGQLLAAGTGQMSRVTSARLAIDLARQNGHAEKLRGAVAGSDAYFPFADGPQMLIDGGIQAIIQPGGSKKDQDTIDACNKSDVALVLTGQRHFRH